MWPSGSFRKEGRLSVNRLFAPAALLKGISFGSEQESLQPSVRQTARGTSFGEILIGVASRIVAFAGLLASNALAVNIQTVPVGNPGNAPDTRYASPGFGSVGYTYKIGKYEATAGQDTEVLDRVAATDTYGLYSTVMARTDYY